MSEFMADADETEADETQAAQPEPEALRAEAALPAEAGDETEAAPAEGEAPAAAAPAEDGKNWYVIHCYSGYENKVRYNLEQRIESMGMKDRIFDVIVPTEEEIEVKDGKRRTVERRVFPGYILVQMYMSEPAAGWSGIRVAPLVAIALLIAVAGVIALGVVPSYAIAFAQSALVR